MKAVEEAQGKALANVNDTQIKISDEFATSFAKMKNPLPAFLAKKRRVVLKKRNEPEQLNNISKDTIKKNKSTEKKNEYKDPRLKGTPTGMP